MRYYVNNEVKEVPEAVMLEKAVKMGENDPKGHKKSQPKNRPAPINPTAIVEHNLKTTKFF